MANFEKELTDMINKYSLENGSDTPDFILAGYMKECLTAYEKAMNARTSWYNGTYIEEDDESIEPQRGYTYRGS